MAANGRKNRKLRPPRAQYSLPRMTTVLPLHLGHPDTQA